MKPIPYGRQEISQADIDAVVEVLQSDFLTQGPKVPAFEQTIAQYTGASYAVAVSNATAALHIACLALDVGPGDYVWTSPISFVASANCALYCGASIDFVDIDPVTFNMSTDTLEAKLEVAEQMGKLPKVVIPVHLGGQSCDMERIGQLAKRYGFSVVEDASHAIGGKYKTNPVGCCDYSDISVFSFHPVKVITTAEGGVATTNNEQLASRMQMLRSHGITKDPKSLSVNPAGWYYEQQSLGFNYRMTELQAALGISQARRLDQFVATRNDLAHFFCTELGTIGMGAQQINPECYSSYHLLIAQLPAGGSYEDRNSLYRYLIEQQIYANLHYIPIYLQPYYRQLGFQVGYCPHAEDYYSRSLSIPLHPQITSENQVYIIESIKHWRLGQQV